jgi:glycine dehydrogenase subunit 1
MLDERKLKDDGLSSRYIPNTQKQQETMLESIGLNSMDQLFDDIPDEVKLDRELNLPKPMAEHELLKHMRKMSSQNVNTEEYCCFMGAGAYDHYIPAVIKHMLSRGEFYTAYTPYQPEISQGTLQAIFEYQTMICELTGMDVANASMYDGASASAEAMILACSSKNKRKVAISRTLNPEYKDVIKTYAKFNNIDVIEVGYKDGVTDLCQLESVTPNEIAAVIVQYPNFFGAIENLADISNIAHRNGSYFIVTADPISLGILKSPGEYGADIVVGEGQSLGNPLSFGGPYLGFFAASKKLMRKMPGRIVGQTTDTYGKRGYVLTLQAREQHIRREKATSNICSNQALNALAATIYLTLLGKNGLRKVAELCVKKSHYAYEKLVGTGRFEPAFNAPFVKEFVVKINEKNIRTDFYSSFCGPTENKGSSVKMESGSLIQNLNKRLLKNNIIGGYDLGKCFTELSNCWLLAVTEKRTKEEIDNFVENAHLGGAEE